MPVNENLNPRGSSAVLVVDDDQGIRTALAAHFTREGWLVRTAASLREAEARMAQEEFALLVSDVRLGDGSGVDLLASVREQSPRMPVILLTAYASVPDAVRAMQAGAGDYLVKPVAWPQLQAIAAKLLAQDESAVAGAVAKKEPQSCAPRDGIVGRAPALTEAIARAHAAASTDADVLIEAESGTGKELLARFIHESSPRASQPFVAVNCAAVPEHLLESELFGHARGAFTGATQARAGKFEMAHGGTLLLDEIGEMPLHLQPKLLRALQEREFERLGETRTVRVNIRVIATTNVLLGAAVGRGEFRSDLYYRLNVIPLTLPPLRERTGDIARLAQHFAETWAARAGRKTPELTPDFLALLEQQSWPGNVRELGNFLRRVFSLQPSVQGRQVIDARCFEREAGTDRARGLGAPALVAQPKPIAPVGVPIRQLERLHLEKTLAMTQGNRTHAAEMLGISIRTMRNKIREYGLPPRRYA